MKIQRSILGPALVALVALVTGGWLLQQGASQEKNVYFQAQLFEEVLHHLADRFVDEKEPAELYRMAIDGLLEELGDPHTVFMTPEDYDRLRVQTRGEYGGLGIQIDERDGWITVISPLPGTPAERAGMQAGDRIIQVEGESTEGWTTDDAVERLRGPRGSAVDLQVRRVGIDEPIPFRVVREHIQIKSVRTHYMIEDGIGYIQLTVFSETSTDELREAIDRLRAQGMKKLILDLRGNPGGLLDQGISVADLFLDRGDAVAETRSRMARQSQALVAVSRDQYPSLPVTVLVNQFSASASEIVAGALQDHDRALLIGETSYGKGSVQTLYPLPGDNFLKMTTARWYTPSGRSIQKPYGIDQNRAHGEEADTTELETFRTDAGRVVYGGGGIRPDVIVKPDTTTLDERAYMKAVQKHGSKYRDVLFNFAVRYGKDHRGLRPDFTVTPRILDEYYRALQEAGIEIDRELFDRASKAVALDLALEILYAQNGEQEARRRLNAEDAQVRAAVRLLRGANDTASLFTRAEQFQQAQARASREASASSGRP